MLYASLAVGRSLPISGAVDEPRWLPLSVQTHLRHQSSTPATSQSSLFAQQLKPRPTQLLMEAHEGGAATHTRHQP